MVEELLRLTHRDGPQTGTTQRPWIQAEGNAISGKGGGRFVCGKQAGNPSFLQDLIAIRGRVPDLDRAKMRTVRVGITHSQDHGKFTRLPERHEWFKGRIEAKVLAQLQDALRWHSELWPQAIILLIAIGHYGV